MRAIVVFLVCLLVACSVEGKSKVAERLKATEAAKESTEAAATAVASAEATAQEQAKQDTVVATPLGGSAGGAAGSSDCGCANNAAATPDASGCGCSNGVSYVSSIGAGAAGGGDVGSWKEMHEKELANLGPRPRVEDAVRPIDEWLTDFTKRSQLQGGLWDAARATVQPLLKRLERTQQEAIDRLKDSNKAIREHVEDAATQHIYNLLRSKRALEDAELAAEQKKAAVGEADALIKRAEEQKKSAQEAAKQMQEAYKRDKEIQDKNKPAGSKGGNTTNTIMSHIAKILAEK